ncbi:MAG: hypothetical protein ABSE15_08475 [Candidatus Bathyarchaeia archaeon]|jgi:hypothetical protein
MAERENEQVTTHTRGLNLAETAEINQILLKLEKYSDKQRAVTRIMYQKTLELEALSPYLSGISVRWVENEKGCLIDSDVQLLGALINEVESISKTFQGTCIFLIKFADENTSALSFSQNNPELNNLLLDFVIRVNDEQNALYNFLSVAEALKKAVSLLNSQPLNTCVRINDPFGFSFRPILVATAIINESANKARTTIDQIKSEEKEWQRLDQNIRSLISKDIPTVEAKQEKDASDDENHYTIEKISKIVSDWAQEKLVKAIYQFDDGISDFKFGRVSQISKLWKEQGLWQVEALIEYTIGGAQKIARNVSFQIDDNFSIIGFNLYEPARG